MVVSNNTTETSHPQDLPALIGRLDEYLRNFSSSPRDPPEKIRALKAELHEIQSHLARFDAVPEHWLSLSWRKLFERQNWRGIYPEGLNPLIEEVRVHWLRAKADSNSELQDPSDGSATDRTDDSASDCQQRRWVDR